MRSGIQRNHRGRRCEEGVKDVDEIPDKEIRRSLGEVHHGGPFARPDDKCNKVTHQNARTDLSSLCRLMFHRRQYRLRYTPAICVLDLLSHTHAREAAGKSRDGELIHLKSFFTPPHHPHCDLNTILVTAVTESLKST